VVLVAIIAAAAFKGEAQDGDITAGHAFAREACRACHMVEAEESSPRRSEIDRGCERVYPEPPRSSLSRAITVLKSHTDRGSVGDIALPETQRPLRD
jgi:hypothetical protein